MRGGERAKRASKASEPDEDSIFEVREMATYIWATFTTKLTHPNRLALKMRLASLGARRQLSMDERTRTMGEMEEKARETKHVEERMALRKQMELEEAERRQIDDIKTSEKEQAEKEMYEVFEQMEMEKSKKRGKEKGKAKKVKATTTAVEKVDYEINKDALDEEVEDGDDIFGDDDIDENSEAAPEAEAEAEPESDSDEELDDSHTPAPRSANIATFKYTPRLFKTPMRESTINQEKDFVAKNRPHLHNNGLLNKDALDISESDPTWLKGKGDDFYRSGDFRSAINAYSSAFETDSTMVAALSNRAACYLQIGEAARCIR